MLCLLFIVCQYHSSLSKMHAYHTITIICMLVLKYHREIENNIIRYNKYHCQSNSNYNSRDENFMVIAINFTIIYNGTHNTRYNVTFPTLTCMWCFPFQVIMYIWVVYTWNTVCLIQCLLYSRGSYRNIITKDESINI